VSSSSSACPCPPADWRGEVPHPPDTAGVIAGPFRPDECPCEICLVRDDAGRVVDVLVAGPGGGEFTRAPDCPSSSSSSSRSSLSSSSISIISLGSQGSSSRSAVSSVSLACDEHMVVLPGRLFALRLNQYVGPDCTPYLAEDVLHQLDYVGTASDLVFGFVHVWSGPFFRQGPDAAGSCAQACDTLNLYCKCQLVDGTWYVSFWMSLGAGGLTPGPTGTASPPDLNHICYSNNTTLGPAFSFSAASPPTPGSFGPYTFNLPTSNNLASTCCQSSGYVYMVFA
jgi:hypothetical protein